MKKQFLSLGLMLLSGVAMAQYPTNGLVAYFPLNGNGDDVGPNAITPSYFNAEAADNRNAEAGRSVHFTAGDQEYIDYDMTAHPELQLSGDFTIAFWAKVDPGYSSGAFLFSLSGAVQFSLLSNPNGSATIVRELYTSNGGGIGYPSLPSPTTWNHFMVIRSGDTYSFYRNNAFVNSSSNSSGTLSFDSNMRLRIAMAQDDSGELDGSVDDLFIYSRALDASERTQVNSHGVCLPVSGTLTIDGPTSLCADGQATYTIQIGQQNVTDYIWEYNGGTGTLTNGSVTITAPAEGQGNPTLTIYGSNECSQGAQFTYAPAVVGTPAPFTITGTAHTCVGSGLAYSVESTGIPVTWDFPDGWVQTNTFPNNNGGQFTAGESGTISFTRDNGCFTRTETLEVNVVQSTPEPPVLTTGSLYPCYGQQELYAFTFDSTVTSSSVSFSTFSSTWTTQADTDTSRFVTPAGWMYGPFNITATATNICGQTQTSVALTTNSGSLDTYGTFYEENGVLIGGTYTGIITRQWLLDGQPIPGATESTYTPTVSGNYSQQVEFINFNCDAFVSDELYVEVTITGVDEATAPELHLYPNPATTSFTMDGLTAGSTITLMDATGRTVSSTAVTAARMEVSVAALSTGIYMVQVMDGNNVRNARLVVN